MSAESKALVAKFLQRKFRNVRETLNTETFHFMPLNVESFRAVLGGSLIDPKDVEKLYHGLVEHLVSKHGKRRIPISSISTLRKDELFNKPSLVYQGTNKNNIIGVIYQNYNSAYNSAFKEYLNKVVATVIKTPFGDIEGDPTGPTDLLSDKKYAGTKYSKGFDVGHLFAGTSAGFGDTPLSYKLRILQEAINNLSNNKLVLAQRSGVLPGSSKRDELVKISASIDAALQKLEEKSNLGIQVIAKLDKTITSNLAKAGVTVVIPQGRIENQREYGTLVESIIEKEIADLLKTLKFSPNLIDGITEAVTSPLTKKSIKNTKSVLDIGKVLVSNPIKTKISKVQTPKTSTTAKIPKTVSKPAISNINLLSILQAAINQQVAKNMGTGSETRILNYRTGRFAESVDVQKISESRQGMISVFYSYMKNPYATFSEGGRQQYPKTRDPKLLISQSIRDIATPIVGNRLRSVVV